MVQVNSANSLIIDLANLQRTNHTKIMKKQLQTSIAKNKFFGFSKVNLPLAFLFIALCITFISCKKDDPTPTPKKNLLETLQSGEWNRLETSMESGENPFGFSVKILYLNPKIKSSFRSDNTFSEKGISDIKMSVFQNGDLENENFQADTIDQNGTYKVLSEKKLQLTPKYEEAIDFEVVSFSDSKIELFFEGPIIDNSDTTNITLKIIYVK